MERERLTRLVREPGKVAREDLVGLKAMAERYPWFGGAHLLLAAGEHAAGEVLFDGTLATSSAHLPDRSVLFDLVEQDRSTVAASTPAPTPVPAPPVVEVKPDPVPEVQHTSSPVAVETVVPKHEVVVPPEPEPVVDDILEKQILEAALASAYDLTWQEQVPVAEPKVHEQGQVQDQAAPAKHMEEEVLPATKVEEQRPVVPVVPVVAAEVATVPPAPISTPAVSRGSKLRFTEWLEASAESEPSTPPPAADPAIVVAAADWLRTPAEPVLPPEPAPAPAPVPAPGPTPTLDTRSLIDRFIQQETPAPAPKTEFYTPQQAAKRSLDDTAGLVTETLARIYEKQGNLPKAIDAYRKLALKFPEKSAYFATLQKALEEQSNK